MTFAPMWSKKKRNTVFIVESNKVFLFILCHKLISKNNIEIVCFNSISSLFNSIHLEPVIIVIDYKLINIGDVNELISIKKKFPITKVVILAEQENQDVFINLGIQLDYIYLIKEKYLSQLADKLIQTIYNLIGNTVYKKTVFKQFVILAALIVIIAILSINIFAY